MLSLQKIQNQLITCILQSIIPLQELATISQKLTENEVGRENGKRKIVVQSNIRGRDLGSFIKDAMDKVDTQIKLPPGYWLSWGGEFEHLQKAKARLYVVVPVSLILIFLILFSTFNSVRKKSNSF